MPDAYEIHDAQFLQQQAVTSAANALSVGLTAVPAGKVWTFFRASGYPSVQETQNFWFAALAAGYYFPVTQPANIQLDAATQKYLPLVREGMELKLFPGERLWFFRDAFTAASTITIRGSYVETDLQYYVELDKHKVLQRRLRALEASSPMRSGGLLGPSSRIPAERSTREPRER